MLTPATLTSSHPVSMSESTASTGLADSGDQAHRRKAQEPAVKLGWILIQKRWISAAQLQATLLQQAQLQQAQLQQAQLQQADQQRQYAKKLGELLIEQSMLSETQLRDALQEQYWRRKGYWVI